MSAQPARWDSAQFRPVAPVGKKLCRECSKTMNARDQHARCQMCRNSGGYLADKYRAICGACGKSYIKDKATTKACSLRCGQLVREGHPKDKKKVTAIS